MERGSQHDSRDEYVPQQQKVQYVTEQNGLHLDGFCVCVEKSLTLGVE